jgi:N-acetyl-anhydromuramyl-L-alanine amidase AmpD
MNFGPVTTINLTNRHYAGRNGSKPTVIGIHTMEAPEAGGTAEAVANYFKTIDASAHWCVDDNSRVRVVMDEDGAWTMPPLNNTSLNVEMAGYASQSPGQWADAYSEETLDNVALCVAEWCHKYGIPIRHLTDDQIRAGNKGIAGHIDVNRVFHASDHTDPGLNFPWKEFLTKVTAHYDNMPSQGSAPDCKPLQQALGFSSNGVDGIWGHDTDKRIQTVRWSTKLQFPNGVSFAQMCVRTPSTGEWDAVSSVALAKEITRIQAAFVTMGYAIKDKAGVWGSSTESAYQAARNRFYTA